MEDEPVSSFEFDLVPDSGRIPSDAATSMRVQHQLLEFMAAHDVVRADQPTRIHVVAHGEPGDQVRADILARLEELCGTRLRQEASEDIAAGDRVAPDIHLLSVIRDGAGRADTRAIDIERNWLARPVTPVPYLGIKDYEPAWHSGLQAIETMHGRRLAALVGRRLTHAWLLWDRKDDTWFADAPVLLDFSGEQLEVQHQKFDDLSLTWNTADPDRPVTFPEFDLAWRDDAIPELASLEGQLVRDVSLLEWRGESGDDMAKGMVAVHVRFDGGQLTVFNALDENGLAFAPLGPQYARRRLR